MVSVRADSSWTGKVSDSPQTWVVKKEIKACKHWLTSLEESQTIPVTGTWGHHGRVTSTMVTEFKTRQQEKVLKMAGGVRGVK